MSKQYDTARSDYEANTLYFHNTMRVLAERELEHGPQLCGCSIASEGLFDPWYVLDGDYNKVVGEKGNADDDVSYISSVWCHVLAEMDYARYEPIIRKLLDIEVNGL